MKRPLTSIRASILPLLLLPLGLFLYRVALRAPFVFDDRGYILDNHTIMSLSNFIVPAGTRYLGFLSFALNYRLSGFNAFDFHLVNIIIHIINALLVYGLVMRTFSTPLMRRLSRGPDGREGVWTVRASAVGVAFVSAVLFLSHPLNAQAVSYITQRFASLATLFYLLAVYLYACARLSMAGVAAGDSELRPPRSYLAWLFYAGALVSTVLAMKTKEISFTIPFIIALYDFFFFRTGWRVTGKWLRAPFYPTLLIIPLTLLLPAASEIPGHGVAEHLRELQLNEGFTLSRYRYVVTQFRVIVTYLRLYLYPSGQRIDYDFRVSTTLFAPAELFSLALLAALFLLAAYMLFMAHRRRNVFAALFSFGIFWFFITLSVESFMVPIQDVIFEHRAYLPGVGFFMAAVSAVYMAADWIRLRGAVRLTPAVVAVVILALVCPPLYIALQMRNRVWADERLLLDEALERSPTKPRLYYARAALQVDRKEYAGAIKDADRSIELFMGIASDPYVIRGIAYSGLGEYERSIKDFDRAASISPQSSMVYFNRGLSYDRLGRDREAIDDYTRSIKYAPGFPYAYLNRAAVYLRNGRPGLAYADAAAACRMGLAAGCSNMKKIGRGGGAGMQGGRDADNRESRVSSED